MICSTIQVLILPAMDALTDLSRSSHL